MVINFCTMTITVKTLWWCVKMTYHFDSLVEGIFNIHFISEIHRCVLTNWPASIDWVVSGSRLNSALLSSWESLCAMIIKDLFMGSCISNSTMGLHNPSLLQTKHICICATAMVSTYLHPQWQLWIKIKWHSIRLSSLHSGRVMLDNLQLIVILPGLRWTMVRPLISW